MIELYKVLNVLIHRVHTATMCSIFDRSEFQVMVQKLDKKSRLRTVLKGLITDHTIEKVHPKTRVAKVQL